MLFYAPNFLWVHWPIIINGLVAKQKIHGTFKQGSSGSSAGSAAAVAAGLITIYNWYRNIGIDRFSIHTLRSNRTSAHIWNSQPYRERWYFAGVWIKLVRFAEAQKMLRLSIYYINGTDGKDPGAS